MKRLLLIALTFGLCALPQAHAGSPIPITSLPATITQPGSYYFVGDLTTPPGAYNVAILITADNVTLDLRGHTLRSWLGQVGPHTTIDIRANNVAIRHGIIYYSVGSSIITNPGFERAVIEHILSSGDGYAVLDQANNTIIQACHFFTEGGIYLGGTGIVITDCYFPRISLPGGPSQHAFNGSVIAGNNLGTPPPGIP
jgi:hypothetical protein